MDSDFRILLPLFLSVLALADDTWTASFEVTEKQPVGTTFGNLTSIYQLQSKYSDVELSKLRFSQLQGPVYNPALDYIAVQETTGLLQVNFNQLIIKPNRSKLEPAGVIILFHAAQSIYSLTISDYACPIYYLLWYGFCNLYIRDI